jgi:hypothetical protein
MIVYRHLSGMARELDLHSAGFTQAFRPQGEMNRDLHSTAVEAIEEIVFHDQAQTEQLQEQHDMDEVVHESNDRCVRLFCTHGSFSSVCSFFTIQYMKIFLKVNKNLLKIDKFLSFLM